MIGKSGGNGPISISLSFGRENRICIIIENKIDSSEHSNQLDRYLTAVKTQYPKFKILPIFLTPEGSAPEHSEFIPMGYKDINEIIQTLLNVKLIKGEPDLLALLAHYGEMLRRHIMPESDVSLLATAIYKKHKRAIDLIIEHKPDLQQEISNFIQEIVASTSDVILDHSTKGAVKFIPKEWDFPALEVGKGWTPSRRILLFGFEIEPEKLRLKLIIGPGDLEMREKIYSLAGERPLKKYYSFLHENWATIYVREFLKKADYESRELGELKIEFSKEWSAFLENDFKAISEIVRSGITQDRPSKPY